MSLIATFDYADTGVKTPSKKKQKQSSSATSSSPAPSSLSRRFRSSIYLGSKEDAKNLDVLQKRRISHILNVTPSKLDVKGGVPNYFEKKQQQQFTYLRIPIFDDATSVKQLQTQELATTIVDFIHRGLYHGNVLVHCHYGISRSTTCVALYLMR
jgi:protein-tyrosine phosphatase